jgi:hypothetical protein
MLNAEIPGFTNQADVFGRAIGLNLSEQSLKPLVDGTPVGNRTGGSTLSL